MTMHVTDCASGRFAVRMRSPLSRTCRSYVLTRSTSFAGSGSMLDARRPDPPVLHAAPVVLARLGGEVDGHDARPDRQVEILRLVLRRAGPDLGRGLVERHGEDPRRLQLLRARLPRLLPAPRRELLRQRAQGRHLLVALDERRPA